MMHKEKMILAMVTTTLIKLKLVKIMRRRNQQYETIFFGDFWMSMLTMMMVMPMAWLMMVPAITTQSLSVALEECVQSTTTLNTNNNYTHQKGSLSFPFPFPCCSLDVANDRTGYG